MVLLLFILFFILLFLGVPIAFALGLGSVGAIIFGSNLPLLVVVQKMYSGINSFPFMAIPLFLLAGNIMCHVKISDKLVAFASIFVGRFPGGLAHISTGASAFFGAISGSSPATTAAIGSIMIPSMEQRGYKKTYSAAVIAASGVLGLIIPPSLTMVIFGVLAGVSIGDLFLSGIIPGIIITLCIMGLNYFIARKKGFGSERPIKGKEALKVFKDSIIALLMPLIILGGIYSGSFTATESASIACLYGLIVGFFIYKTLSLKELFIILKDTAESAALIMLLMSTANLFSYIIAREEIPQKLASLLLGITTNHIIIMFIIMVGLLIIGTFLDNVAALVLTVPTLLGVIEQTQINPIYFGIFMIITLAVGQITPPVGLNLFVASNIAKVKFEGVIKNVIPYILLYIVILIVFIFFPGILTVLVN